MYELNYVMLMKVVVVIVWLQLLGVYIHAPIERVADVKMDPIVKSI